LKQSSHTNEYQEILEISWIGAVGLVNEPIPVKTRFLAISQANTVTVMSIEEDMCGFQPGDCGKDQSQLDAPAVLAASLAAPA
jgi:hypothetical protein